MQGGLTTLLVVNLGVDQGTDLLLLDAFLLCELLDEAVLGLEDIVYTLPKTLILDLVDLSSNAKLFLLSIIHRPASASRFDDVPGGIAICMSAGASHDKLGGGVRSCTRGRARA